MGIFSKTEKILSAAPTLNLPAGVLSETLPLESVIFPDLDFSQYPVTISEAVAVPAVSRAMALYSSISSRFVLNSTDNSTPWLTDSYGPITPQVRIAWTIQDLIFYNRSLWAVKRDSNGTIIVAEHVANHRWSTDSNGLVRIDDKPFDQTNLIYFAGLMPGGGFLENARHSVRQYTSIAATINARANNPEPVTIVRETQDNGATPEEVNTLMDDVEAAGRQGVRNSIIFQPYGMEIVGYGGSDNSNAMMVSARNAVRLDLANHLNISASLLEGAADGSSDTYTSTLLIQNELLELSIKAFTQPIADRLSANDVTPQGVRVEFDYSTFDTAPNDNNSKGTVPAPTEEVPND